MQFENRRGVGRGGELMVDPMSEGERAGMVSEVAMTYIGNLDPKAGDDRSMRSEIRKR